MRLDGKVTLITGVSQYMGPAFSKTFTDAGAVVCTHDRSRADAEPHAEYAKNNPGGGLILEADLTKPTDVDAMFGAIDEQFGRIDILVSNHSIVASIPCPTITVSPSTIRPRSFRTVAAKQVSSCANDSHHRFSAARPR